MQLNERGLQVGAVCLAAPRSWPGLKISVQMILILLADSKDVLLLLP